jgi:hypothetical protein
MTISLIQRPQQALSLPANGLAQFPASWQRTGIYFQRATDGRAGIPPLVSGTDTAPVPGPATQAYRAGMGSVTNTRHAEPAYMPSRADMSVASRETKPLT